MKRLLCVVPLSLWLVSPASAADSVWDHNNSVMRMTSNGNARTIVYEKPRAGIANEGVQPGTVLFQGEVDAKGKYQGTAHIFSRRCGTQSYPVTGELINDGTAMTFSGEAPDIDRQTCARRGSKDGRIVFSFVRSNTMPTFRPLAQDSVCFVTDWEGYQQCLEQIANELCQGREELEDLVRCFRIGITHVYKASGMSGTANAVADTPFTTCTNGVCKMWGGGYSNSCNRVDAMSVRECDGNVENERCEDVACPIRQCRKVCAGIGE